MTLTVATAISPRLEGKFASELKGVDGVELVRRCADVAEVLSVAEAGLVEVVALSADFPGVNGSLIAELAMRGATVLAVVSPTSVMDARQFESWGVLHAHIVGSGELASTLRELESAPNASKTGNQAAGTREASAEAEVAQPVVEPSADEVQAAFTSMDAASSGRLIVVWGPPGAPGRTTTALNLASALAHDGATLVIDADTQAPSCAPYLGLLDEAPGILAAARLADAGTLNATQLQSLTSKVEEGFDVLSGIGVPGRWSELGRFHIDSIVEAARAQYSWIVVDVSSSYEADESLMYDTVAPLRHAATLAVLETADIAVAVVAAEPISLQRFVHHWPLVRQLCGRWEVVISKARSHSVGGSPLEVVSKALRRFAGVEPNIALPWAAELMDEAQLQAQLVCGLYPDAEYAQGIARLAEAVGAQAIPVAKGRRSWFKRPRGGRN